MTPGEIVGLAAAAALMTLGAGSVVEGFVALQGRREVQCPVDGRRGTVRLDVPYSAVQSLLGHRRYRVGACSRWPGRARCGQLCLDALESGRTR
jgi:hypothetical protein